MQGGKYTYVEKQRLFPESSRKISKTSTDIQQHYRNPKTVEKSHETELRSEIARNRHIIAIYARFSRKISAIEKTEKRAAENRHILSPQSYAPGQSIQDQKARRSLIRAQKTAENRTIFTLSKVSSERETDTE